MERSYRHLGRTILLCILALLLLAAVLAIGVRYGWIPWFGDVNGSAELYTNADTQTFGCEGLGQGRLNSVIASDGKLTVSLSGEYTGRERTANSGGGSGKTAVGVSLQVGDAQYPTVSFSSYIRHNIEFGMTFVFSVPTSELSDGMKLTLLLPGGFGSVSFTLKSVDFIPELPEHAQIASNDYLDVAAEFSVNEDEIAVQLYHVNHTELQFVCYGFGGGFSTVVPGGTLCLRADGETLYCLDNDSPVYIPTSFRFQNTHAAETSLELPCVIMKSDETAVLHRHFASADEALQYSEIVELEGCTLRFGVERLADGSLTLSCVFSDDKEEQRAVGLESDFGGFPWMITPTGRAGSRKILSVLPDNGALTDSLTLDYKLSGVCYAVMTNFRFEVK